MPRRLVARLTIAGALALGAAGCIRGSLPPIELYRLELPGTPEAIELGTGPAVPRLPGSIAIAAYETPGLYGDAAIPYRVGETQYGTYPSREWAIPLGAMLGMLTQRILETHPLTADGALYDPPNGRQATYRWRGVVREFEEVDRDTAVYAAVALDVQLLRVADDSLVWSGSIRREARVPAPTMPAIVRRLSELAAAGLADAVRQARADLVVSDSAALPK